MTIRLRNKKPTVKRSIKLNTETNDLWEQIEQRLKANKDIDCELHEEASNAVHKCLKRVLKIIDKLEGKALSESTSAMNTAYLSPTPSTTPDIRPSTDYFNQNN